MSFDERKKYKIYSNILIPDASFVNIFDEFDYKNLYTIHTDVKIVSWRKS